jgi:integrase
MNRYRLIVQIRTSLDTQHYITEDEKNAIDEVKRSREKSGRYKKSIIAHSDTLARLLSPIDRVFEALSSTPKDEWLLRFNALLAMRSAGKVIWYFDKSEWLDFLKDNPKPAIYRNYPDKVRLAYCLGNFTDFDAMPGKHPFDTYASEIFGVDLISGVCERVFELLVAAGTAEKTAEHELRRTVSWIIFSLGQWEIENWTLEKLKSLYHLQIPKLRRKQLFSISKALFNRGLISEQLDPSSLQDRSSTFEKTNEGINPRWLDVTELWGTLTTKSTGTVTNTVHHLKKIGRWLAKNYPDIESPSDWTVDVAHHFLKDLLSLKVGDFCSVNLKEAELGKPLNARSKLNLLRSIRVLFYDFELWELGQLQFNAKYVFVTPSDLQKSNHPKPRIIRKATWQKLIEAGRDIEEKDLPQMKIPGFEASYYPKEFIKALTVVWLVSGLRIDEIRRLEVGCTTWDESDASKAKKFCYLKIPANKGGGEYVKPVAGIVGLAIEEWESKRPSYAQIYDEKGRKKVNFLFFFKGQQLGANYLNKTLIPALCHKANVPMDDEIGKITSHRARATIATELATGPNPMSYAEIALWLNHKSVNMTRFYVAITKTQAGEAFRKANVFQRNLRRIEVLIDQGAIQNGDAASGKAWKYYDLGHGYCTDEFFEKCNHRMACARCSFYKPKESLEQQLISTANNIRRYLREINLNEEETLAVSGDLEACERLIEKLRDLPARDGQTPAELDAS